MFATPATSFLGSNEFSCSHLPKRQRGLCTSFSYLPLNVIVGQRRCYHFHKKRKMSSTSGRGATTSYRTMFPEILARWSLLEPRFRPLSLGSDKEKCRPLDHTWQIRFIHSVQILTTDHFYIYIYQSTSVISSKWYVKVYLGTVGIWQLRMYFAKTLSSWLITIIQVILSSMLQVLMSSYCALFWTNEIGYYLSPSHWTSSIKLLCMSKGNGNKDKKMTLKSSELNIFLSVQGHEIWRVVLDTKKTQPKKHYYSKKHYCSWNDKSFQEVTALLKFGHFAKVIVT